MAQFISNMFKAMGTHTTEMAALGAAGGCTITAALYARARQRALDSARRNWSSKSGKDTAQQVTKTAAEAESAGAKKMAAAAAATGAVARGSARTYSKTEQFALALWHG